MNSFQFKYISMVQYLEASIRNTNPILNLSLSSLPHLTSMHSSLLAFLAPHPLSLHGTRFRMACVMSQWGWWEAWLSWYLTRQPPTLATALCRAGGPRRGMNRKHSNWGNDTASSSNHNAYQSSLLFLSWSYSFLLPLLAPPLLCFTLHLLFFTLTKICFLLTKILLCFLLPS